MTVPEGDEMSEPKVDIGIDYDRQSGQIVVAVDIDGSSWFDGSGATLEAALIEALKAAASYAAKEDR